MPDATTEQPWGATAADWDHFVQLGLREDLLPVVSDPHATISPLSKMTDLGKTPSLFNSDGHAVGIPKWTQRHATAEDIGRCKKDNRLGICVQTRELRAIDIDLADPAHAAEARWMVEMTEKLPVRFRSNSGKCLLIFRMPGDFSKRILKTAHGNIEFLATGQQFIAVGTHPSGARYEWEGGLPDDIPTLTPDQFEAMWAFLAMELGLPDGDIRAGAGVAPTVPRQAGDSTDDMVGYLEEHGWVTGYERDGRVDVRCPWEAGHSTDTGASSTSYFPAGVGGFHQGHFRCLHASCAGRTDHEFIAATGYLQAEFEVVVPEAQVVDAAGGVVAVQTPLPLLQRNEAGQAAAELNNILTLLRSPEALGYGIGFDEFRDMLMISEHGKWRSFTDNDYTMLRSLFAAKARFKPIGADLMKDAVRYIGHERRFDSAIQWGNTLQWDGVERVDTFYSDFFGVADSPYTRAVAAYTWTALAARCMEPGAKCDMVPVLIGLQGAGKTSAIEALCPIAEAFVELNLERKDDDLSRSLRGKLVGEIAELRGLQGRDAEAIKAFISRRWEEWVGKWREYASRFPRRLLMFGTGNQQGFLDDETGERRWLPMVVGEVDVPGIVAIRDQLWAEGIHRFRAGGVAWQDAYRLAPTEHAAFKVGDPWDEPIARWLESDEMEGAAGPKRGDGVVRSHQVMVGAIGLRIEQIDMRAEKRVAKCLRRRGYEKCLVREGKVVFKAWRKPQIGEDFA